MNTFGISAEEYDRLEKEINDNGLNKRTYFHYAAVAAVYITLIATSLYFVTVSDSIVFQIMNGFLLAVASVQIGIIGHDLSHGAVFKSEKLNQFFASLAFGLMGGLSEVWWRKKHNLHHKAPNHIGVDADLTIPFVFTSKQATIRSKFLHKYILPFQHILFWPALSFVYPWNLIMGFGSYLTKPTLRFVFELILIAIHFWILFYITFSFLPLEVGVAYIGSHFLFSGVYMGLIFAPNHKGMSELSESEEFHWVHQITNTRNLISPWYIFHIYGGLNFQIEHHLFPSLSRKQHWKARLIVMEFCKNHGVPYHQTSVMDSWKEMYRALKKQSILSKR